MNVIIYWKSGDYADVYNVDEVKGPTKTEPDLRLFKRFKGEDVEIARFHGDEFRGWQVFLTADDAQGNR